MDKSIFYGILDIDSLDEFVYFENVQALLEEDEFIEDYLINDLLGEIDMELFGSLLNDYFDEFLKDLPDNENNLYITIEEIRGMLLGFIEQSTDKDTVDRITEELVKLRKWYVHDQLVYDLDNGCELSVRDARYNIKVTNLIGGKCNYDFRLACEYDADGYDFKLNNIINDTLEEENDFD